MHLDTILVGDSRKKLRKIPSNYVDMCVTSPPYYGLRNYNVDEQIGQDQTLEEYINSLEEVFTQVYRILKPDGTLWLNLGDTYCGTGSKENHFDPRYKYGRNGQQVAINHKVDGLKAKNLLGVPWKVAFALQKKGWILRQDIIWYKPNAMPESIKDRCTRSHEYIFLFSKQRSYFYDFTAIQDLCILDNTKKKNKRDVWSISTVGYKGKHFATFPVELAQTCIKAGCPCNGIVLDPFMGAGTTAVAALHEKKHFVGIELNPEYVDLSLNRIKSITGKK